MENTSLQKIMGNKYQSFWFVVNNWTEANKKKIKKIVNTGKVSYVIHGDEVGEQGTPHIQGYLWTSEKKQIIDVVRLLGGKDCVHPAVGVSGSAKGPQYWRDYCTKQGTNVYEYGVMPTQEQHEEDVASAGQGKRNDINAAVACIKEDMGKRNPMKRVCEEHPEVVVKFHKGLEYIARNLVEPRSQAPEIWVFYGKTGVGKSRRAREMVDVSRLWTWNPGQGSWFDGFFGQEYALFEEFRGQLPLGTVLSFTDRYECRAPCKGSFVEFNATKIIFTSPKHPKNWYENMDDDKGRDQLLRRITHIIEVI